ncbi:MAG: protein-L-isoaspartate(D-aspartate) O-methyltransferase [Saprospiraceae bacterium]|nr:protein-L-isoaspartate(D-aspartate) O-methyltransferase [Candidatus Vicinibacter affinis]MBP6174258.1 protein-L-isoaspartate(D-aspartate) O-methyltransferase [Saprospiraceae bacterium]MBK6574432.1 protein-L-isoaspartate(D-aspartate) O-methyltransferase [Candidatus Vicinibacter affinis]MBK6824835.1 protein-L-isoaspartate(D-aspartate) O-methyltransferase [Candidatus Vicinibacter affinis]MBK7304532.1 protein-L-isoaspartate(D-aspartate) O-methyltransferase [Candidatus Vicinibacter affinis]
MVTDNYRQKGLRKKLVAELASKGIKDEQVLEAILKVPRHAFLDKAFEEWSYKDQAFPIDCEQTISQPYTVAFQTSLLKLIKGEKVLEIGLGSGYQACVLFEMGAKVYSIERHKYLHDKTAQRLKHLGYMGIRTFYGDGFLGLPRFAPFDKILITAACPEIPSKLLEQLKPGGLMVLPLESGGGVQTMVRIIKELHENFTKEDFGHFKFVPMLKGIV